jgi:hypothetical protein
MYMSDVCLGCRDLEWVGGLVYKRGGLRKRSLFSDEMG